MGSKSCDRCGVMITFARSASTGNWMPVDDESSEDGNIRLELDKSPVVAHVLGSAMVEDARANGEFLHVSHFVTCPHAHKFRRR